jgi:hypothetical protein
LIALPVAILIATTMPSIAAAAPQDEADALAAQGIELRRSGDDKGALPLFRKAHQLAPTPRTAVQLGLVEQALGQWADAEEHLAEGLRSPRDPWIRKNRPVIDEQMRTVKGHIGSVEVTGDPAGAQVLVNGRSVGSLPLASAVRVSAGSVDVEVNAPGYARAFRTVTVGAGQYQTVVIRLEKAIEATSRTVPHPEAPKASPEPDVGPPRPWQRWAAIGAFAGAAVGAGAGAYGIVKYNDRVHMFNRKCDESSGGALDRTTHQPDAGCAQLQSDYHGARTLSLVGFSAAGVLAATGVVLFLTAPDSTTRPTRVACAPQVARVGAVCRVGF